MITTYIMAENLNQLREKQLRGVIYDYIWWIGVSYGYLLVNTIVIRY